jgi:peptide chain release factor 1
MIDWVQVQEEYDEIVQKLTNTSLDRRTRGDLQRKASQMSQLLSRHKEINECQQTITENKELAEMETGELKELCEQEVIESEEKLKELNRELEDLLYPADDRDSCSVFLEIRAGTGGQEAALFAYDLFKMYNNYALAHNWHASIVESSATDIGGYKDVVAHIKGKNVFKSLKFESGVHRVQRVPSTEGSGRVHTSTVTVAILPEVEDVAIEINPQDLRIDVFRASGAGGQHVNTTDSAVRITHLPTGLVVSCQDERSQLKNKNRAMKVLKARLDKQKREQQDAEKSAQRKQQIGTGERAEKIRTYNFPQNRVTDHRTGVSLKKLDLVMEGDLDDLLNPLREWELTERKKQGMVI